MSSPVTTNTVGERELPFGDNAKLTLSPTNESVMGQVDLRQSLAFSHGQESMMNL
jgi:hypothetical protein